LMLMLGVPIVLAGSIQSLVDNQPRVTEPQTYAFEPRQADEPRVLVSPYVGSWPVLDRMNVLATEMADPSAVELDTPVRRHRRHHR